MKTNKYGGRVHTRFPPEPNGYLHIGHAKSIQLNFGLAKEFGGKCNLRFDDTNPSKEETEYVDSIIEDVQWLGGDWEDRLFYASDYFGQLYEWAVQLIKAGKAYVCDLTPDEVRQAARDADRSRARRAPIAGDRWKKIWILFARMKAGEFPDGARTLRAKIDMASPNLNLRDPIMYRILHAEHHRTGNQWCIYPMYDFAHGESDSIEGITHSICTLEFEDHRPLYDWYVEQLGIYHPQQIEFDRLNLTYTLLSKRKLLALVQNKLVQRLGRSAHAHHFRAAAARLYAGSDPQFLPARGCFEDQRHHRAGIAGIFSARGFEQARAASDGGAAAAAPGDRQLSGRLKVEQMEAVNNPEDESMGSRTVPFSRVLYIEQDDFREDPPKQYFRLAPGREVRLRYGYFVTCTSVVKDANGQVTEIHCTYDPATRGGNRTGRAQSEVDHSLGVGRACDRRRGSLVRYVVHARRSESGGRGAGLHRESESAIARSGERREAGAELARSSGRERAINSSGWAISRWIRTPRRTSWCSIARWRCAIPGPKLRKKSEKKSK